jgi:DnaJ-class molecular chaperone
MILKDNKISIAEHNRIIQEVKEAHADYQEAKALAAEAEACQVMPNCPECKGEGEVEEAGDPAFTHGDPIHRQCSNCKGKGYV